MLKKKLSNQQKLEKPQSGDCLTEDVSKYFCLPAELTMPQFSRQVLDVQQAFSDQLAQLDFQKPPIQYVYNPLDYAKIPNELYHTKYCQTAKKLLFVGMNPGPFGMCQTGVPFGDVGRVREWLKIEGPVSKPLRECPERPVRGFQCTRKEQSGDRFWKFWESQCGNPENFFRNAFVYNYCPLAFMNSKGLNLTPADIKDFKDLELVCDKFFLKVIELFEPHCIIAIGRYTEKRTQLLLKKEKILTPILCMPHPSPRAVNNQNWHEKAKQFLVQNNLTKYFNQK